MDLPMMLIILALISNTTIASSFSPQINDAYKQHLDSNYSIKSNEIHVPRYTEDDLNILRKTSSQFLARKPSRFTMTCDNYPRVCAAKGSRGPDCCRKLCVDVLVDRLNCGMCGKRCKFMEICCDGWCVNPLFDVKNCGKCKNKCKGSGNKCVYGMCSYA